MPDRIFTEEEVKEIIRRASEQQAEAAERQEARRHGLTLDDLERLGAEVGLDPVYLRRAADEVRTGRRMAVQAETETDTHVIVEHWVDCPFTPEAWEDTVSLLRSRFGVDMGMWYGRSGEGHVERVGRAHEWVHMSQLGVETRVSASEREGRTRLLLSQRVGHASPKVEGIAYGAAVGLTSGLIGTAVWADAGGMSGWLLFVLLMLVTTLVAAPLITRLDRSWRQKKQHRLKELAAEVEDVFETVSSQVATPSEATSASDGAAAAPGPRLGLDGLPDAPEDIRPSERSRTRS